MGFVAIKGGENAIKNALKLFDKDFIDETIEIEQILKSMNLRV